MIGIVKIAGGVVLFLALMAVVTISRGHEDPVGSRPVKEAALR